MRKLIHAVLALAGLVLVTAPASADDPPLVPKETPPPPPPAPAPPPPKASPSLADAIGALIAQSPEVVPEGNAVAAPVFAEEMTPPQDPQNPNALRFAAHGYFRAPLRLGFHPCASATPSTGTDTGTDTTAPTEPGQCIHTPWLVDDDPQLSGFVYTRNAEADFTELYLMAGNQHVTGTVGLAGSLYSDYGGANIATQLGIAQGFVTYRYKLGLAEKVKLRMRVKGGAFQDRFGWQEKYDTYLFGRTHQAGENIRADLDLGKLTLSVQDGFGARLGTTDQGLSLLHTLRVGAAFDKTAELAFYYLRTWTTDKRQLQPITDAGMKVIGVEARADAWAFGRAQVGVSTVSVDQGRYLSPSIELMHAWGGRGLEQHYLGTESSNNGTGSLLNVGFQYDFSLAVFLKKLLDAKPLGQGDIDLSVFGMFTKVSSEQKDNVDPVKNKDGVKKFKWGGELSVWPLSFLSASVRYDRVVPDESDDPSAFRIISPRITAHARWFGDAKIFLQWSHYMYGRRVQLRQGQVPLETEPDPDMVKIQAEMTF